MIKMGDEGYIFISKKGVKYDLLEGMTIGVAKRLSSNMIFVVLSDEDFDDYDYLGENEVFAGWTYGALSIEDEKGYLNEILEEIVDDYEKENNINVFISSEERKVFVCK